MPAYTYPVMIRLVISRHCSICKVHRVAFFSAGPNILFFKGNPQRIKDISSKGILRGIFVIDRH